MADEAGFIQQLANKKSHRKTIFFANQPHYRAMRSRPQRLQFPNRRKCLPICGYFG